MLGRTERELAEAVRCRACDAQRLERERVYAELCKHEARAGRRVRAAKPAA